MKNTILYYYDLININITQYKNKALIKSNNDIYLFQEISNTKEVLLQYELTKNISNYYKFIFNKDNSLFTTYKDSFYVLLKINYSKFNLLKQIINPISVTKVVDYKPWTTLWMQKCDFIEYQNAHITGKFPVIDESIDYYVGLLETAIAYLNYNYQEPTKYYLQHKRIAKDNFYNPLNIKIDTRERDIAEYFKFLFYTDNYTDDIFTLLSKLNFTKEESIRFFSRMLYPSYYLDLYDKVVNSEINEDQLKKVVLKTTSYESFLKDIFLILNKNNNLPTINWLIHPN